MNDILCTHEFMEMEEGGPEYPRRTMLFDAVEDTDPPQLEALSIKAEKDGIARFDVGGVKFTTSLSTLIKRDRGSWLAAKAQRLITGRAQYHECEEVVINRGGNLFRYVLNWLRDGVVTLDLGMPTYQDLLEEAEYYKLAGMVVAINWMLRKIRDNVDVKSLRPEMSRQDFIKLLHYGSGLKLRGVNLSGLNLSNLDLRGADLRRARLIKTNFENADLKNANFEDCEATGANFRMARLESCKFTGSRMVGAVLDGSNLKAADLSWARLTNASFRKASLVRARVDGANLYKADLYRADVRGTKLWKATLGVENLSEAEMS